jgi:outer membrane protein TolC
MVPDLEADRTKAEAVRRRIAVEHAFERWQIASAELVRLLRLAPGCLVDPAEDPAFVCALCDDGQTLDDALAAALLRRPELAAHRALVEAALARVKQERTRPLYPTLMVRGVGSNTPGIAGGSFGGGVNDNLSNFGSRFSVDLQAVWELQNLGLGNRAAVREREADGRRALAELLRTQDAIAAEVVRAKAQLDRSGRRLAVAGEGVASAVATADKNLRGLGQTKRAGEALVLVFRPQEAVAALAALDQAYRDFYAAVGDRNRAQFRYHRALGGGAPHADDLATVPREPAEEAAPRRIPVAGHTPNAR